MSKYKILLYIPKAIFMASNKFYLKFFRKQELEIFNPFLIIGTVIFFNLVSIHILLKKIDLDIEIDILFYLIFGVIFSFFLIYYRRNYKNIIFEFDELNKKDQNKIKTFGSIYILLSFLIFILFTIVFLVPGDMS